ncbi:MAG: hypothetical protein EOP88_21080 [Verrucomicrobiaceae bacterium]|nr:MAG: hypothetical protein EOP88_21080 [Verrucomicrobiaceae bacterium]
MLKRLSVILLCVLPAGWLLGRAWSRGDAGPGGAAEMAPHSSGKPTREREETRRRSLDEKEFLDLIRSDAAAMAKPAYNPLASVLADWSDAEVIAALKESLANPALHGLPGEDGNASLLLLTEWMRRDVDGVVKWFDSLDSTLLKTQLSATLAESWPADRADEGFAYLLANEGIFRSARQQDLFEKGMGSAFKKGPAAVSQMLQAAREANLNTFHGIPEAPPGFDFRTVADSGELGPAIMKDRFHPVLRAWAKQDRDAAYQWTLANLGGQHVYGQILGSWGGDAISDFTWSATQYEHMTGEQRQEFMTSAGNFLGRDMDRVPALSAAIEDPVLRDELRMQGVQGIFSGRPEIGEKMLELLGSPEERLQILEDLERQTMPEHDGNRQSSLDGERLRNLIKQWTTDQARIDRIVEHLKQ